MCENVLDTADIVRDEDLSTTTGFVHNASKGFTGDPSFLTVVVNC